MKQLNSYKALAYLKNKFGARYQTNALRFIASLEIGKRNELVGYTQHDLQLLCNRFASAILLQRV